jgi:hypothetical protein
MHTAKPNNIPGVINPAFEFLHRIATYEPKSIRGHVGISVV